MLHDPDDVRDQQESDHLAHEHDDEIAPLPGVDAPERADGARVAGQLRQPQQTEETQHADKARVEPEPATQRQDVQTGDIGNRCTRTWVTLSSFGMITWFSEGGGHAVDGRDPDVFET